MTTLWDKFIHWLGRTLFGDAVHIQVVGVIREDTIIPQNYVNAQNHIVQAQSAAEIFARIGVCYSCNAKGQDEYYQIGEKIYCLYCAKSGRYLDEQK